MTSLLYRSTRREFLTVGGLTALGLTSSTLNRLSASSPVDSKHRRNSCVFLFLFGGPSQIDLWDMKPARPGRSPRRLPTRATPMCPASTFANTCRGLGAVDGQGLPAAFDDAPDECARPGVQRGVQRPAILLARRSPTRPAARTGRRSARWSLATASRDGDAPPRWCCRGTCSSRASRSASPAKPADGWASATTPSWSMATSGDADYVIEGLELPERRAAGPTQPIAERLLERMQTELAVPPSRIVRRRPP